MFKSVTCELFPRKTTPKYPSRNEFADKYDYLTACRAITWKTANRDISMLRRRNYIGRRYQICGVSYPDARQYKILSELNRKNFFIASAPPKIKKLAKNLNDRTDPLWDIALQYINPNYSEPSRYVFKITGIKRV